MYLVRILLPLFDNDGNAFPPELYHQISDTLTEKFDGLTAYNRAPAEGKWKSGDKQITHDDIVVFEIMCENLDKKWWRAYCEELEAEFRQEHIVIRAHAVDIL